MTWSALFRNQHSWCSRPRWAKMFLATSATSMPKSKALGVMVLWNVELDHSKTVKQERNVGVRGYFHEHLGYFAILLNYSSTKGKPCRSYLEASREKWSPQEEIIVPKKQYVHLSFKSMEAPQSPLPKQTGAQCTNTFLAGTTLCDKQQMKL